MTKADAHDFWRAVAEQHFPGADDADAFFAVVGFLPRAVRRALDLGPLLPEDIAARIATASRDVRSGDNDNGGEH